MAKVRECLIGLWPRWTPALWCTVLNSLPFFAGNFLHK